MAGRVVDDPADEWRGMPEFVSEDQQPFRSINVHFATAEDVERFAEATGCTIPPKAKYLWFPPRPMAHPSRNPYVDGPKVSRLRHQ